jgi:7-carboxy-7-deazaguanine synthase
MDLPMLRLIEIFASVQGETSFSGLPTTFIRLAACNLRCSWCDTPYSFGRGDPWEITEILNQVKKNDCLYVCVTGGEPLLQSDVHTLLKALCDEGKIVSLETGGSLSIDDVDPRVRIILDIKCPGSSMSHKNYWENLPLLRFHDEVKFVILDRDDYNFAKDVCSRYNLYHQVKELLFSPVHGKLDSKTLVEWILEDHLRVRLNLQLHKFIWDPAQRGV